MNDFPHNILSSSAMHAHLSRKCTFILLSFEGTWQRLIYWIKYFLIALSGKILVVELVSTDVTKTTSTKVGTYVYNGALIAVPH